MHQWAVAEDISRAMKIIHGTAVASGIKVEGYEEWLATSASQLQSGACNGHCKHIYIYINRYLHIVKICTD